MKWRLQLLANPVEDRMAISQSPQGHCMLVEVLGLGTVLLSATGHLMIKREQFSGLLKTLINNRQPEHFEPEYFGLMTFREILFEP